jgi:hypothetical protein
MMNPAFQFLDTTGRLGMVGINLATNVRKMVAEKEECGPTAERYQCITKRHRKQPNTTT